ncbi:MAG: hypothetical protein LBR41_01055 [Rickettsiales bacterium]|jgi:acyl-ACP thioesterase|nr:hypothetical protein [Rickettsiales bacterium]
MDTNKKMIVRKKLATYQMDRRGILRPVMLLNELQAVADEHAELLGGGRTYCGAHNIAWVVTHMIVEIDWMPDNKTEIIIETWPAVHGNVKAVRDFRILDAVTGRVLVRASSQWVVIDIATRHPVRLGDVMSSWPLLSERALDIQFDAFPDFEPTKSDTVKPRYDDVDMNQHINNAVYGLWATEACGADFLNTHVLRGIKINFKREIPAETPEIHIETACGDTLSQHRLTTNDDTVNANIVCEWK